jgi:3-methyladenine DNA glycosylase Tag
MKEEMAIPTVEEMRYELAPSRSMIQIRNALGMLECVLTRFPEVRAMVQYYDSLSPMKITSTEILAELSWVVYSSGFRHNIVKKYWHAISQAFQGFDVTKVASLCKDLESEARWISRDCGFNNVRKAMWCIQNACRILELDSEKRTLGGLAGYFMELSRKDICDLVGLAPLLVEEFRFKGIGNTTIFHLMKNLGIDVFKPDIHVRRILAKLGLIHEENASTVDICRAMLLLSQASQLRMIELDTLLFEYGRMTGDSIVPEIRAAMSEG